MDEKKLAKYLDSEIEGYKDTIKAYPNSDVDYESGAIGALEHVKNKMASGSFD